MTRKVVGTIAKIMGAIPVKRPQDYKISGTGLISGVKGETVVIGDVNTRFLDEFEAGKSLYVKAIGDAIRVQEVCGNGELILSSPLPVSFENESYAIYPRISQEEVYDSVWKTLRDGRCIGIFPEGGSHDRTELLELKAGVTLMALGAMEKYDIPVYIVPCGLNYFSGHRFRGSVLVQYGQAYRVPQSLVDTYRESKRAACGELLGTIADLMHSVLAEAPDYETLQTCIIVRKFYTPNNVLLTPDEYLTLQRRFVAGFIKFKEEPTLKVALEETKEYIKELDFLGLKDDDIATETAKAEISILISFLGKSALMLLTSILLLPAVLLNLPVGIFLRYMANKEAKKALAKSTVKIKANDTLASVKVVYGFVLLPLSYTIYSLLVWWRYGFFNAVLFFIACPLGSYISMLVTEQGLAVLSYFFIIAKMKWGNKRVQELRAKRKRLVEITRQIVDEFGPRLISNFNETRVVKKDQLENDTPDRKLSSPKNLLKTGSVSLKKTKEEPEPEPQTEYDWGDATNWLFEHSPL